MSIEAAARSIWRESLQRPLGHLLNRLLPQDCQLCGQTTTGVLLCAPCLAELPRLNATRCPVCALPTPGATVCGACLRHPPHFDATHASLAYAFPVDQLVQTLKYGHQLALSALFARLMLSGPVPRADLILALPLSPRHLRERGFNQALEIARPLARASGIALDLHRAVRIADTAPQASLPWKQRRANVRHAFEYRGELDGKSVVVIDDVMTTGATLDEFARTLKRQGAARVTNWVLARTLKHET